MAEMLELSDKKFKEDIISKNTSVSNYKPAGNKGK